MRISAYIIFFLFTIVLCFTEDDPYCKTPDAICVDDSGLENHYSSLNYAIGNVSENSGIRRIYIGKNINLVDDEGSKVLWIGRSSDQAEGNETHPIIIEPHPFNTTFNQSIIIDCGLLPASAMDETNFRAASGGANMKNFFYIGKPFWKISGNIELVCSINSYMMLVIGPETKGKVDLDGIRFRHGSLSSYGYGGILIYENSNNETLMKEFNGVRIHNCSFHRFHHAIRVQFGKSTTQLDLEGDYFYGEDDYKIEISHSYFEEMSQSISSSAVRFNRKSGDGYKYIGMGLYLHDCQIHKVSHFFHGDNSLRTKIENNNVDLSSSSISGTEIGIRIGDSRNSTISGNLFKFNDAKKQEGIFILGTKGANNIFNNTFKGEAESECIELFNSGKERVNIYDNIFENASIVIRNRFSPGCEFNFYRNTIKKNVQTVVEVKYASNFDIIDNVFLGTNDFLVISNAGSTFSIRNNSGYAGEIWISGGSEVTMENNILDAYPGNHILKVETSSTAVLKNNIFRSFNSEEFSFKVIGDNNVIKFDDSNLWEGQKGVLFENCNSCNLDGFYIPNLRANKTVMAFTGASNTTIHNHSFVGGIEISSSSDLVIEGNNFELFASGIQILSSAVKFSRNFVFRRVNDSSNSLFDDVMGVLYMSYDSSLRDGQKNTSYIENNVFDIDGIGSTNFIRITQGSSSVPWYGLTVVIQNNQFLVHNYYESPFMLLSNNNNNIRLFDSFYFISNVMYGLISGVEYVDYVLIEYDDDYTNSLMCSSKCLFSWNYYRENYIVLKDYQFEDVKIEYNRRGEEMDVKYNSSICDPSTLNDVMMEQCYGLTKKFCGEYYDEISPQIDFDNQQRSLEEQPQRVSITVGAFEVTDQNCSSLLNYTKCPPYYYRQNGVCNVTKCFSIFSNDSSVCGGKGKCTLHDICRCSNYSYHYGENCNITWDGQWVFLLGGKEWEGVENCPAKPREDIRILQLRNHFCYQSESGSSTFITYSSSQAFSRMYANNPICEKNYECDPEPSDMNWVWSSETVNFSIPVLRKSEDFSPLREAMGTNQEIVNSFIAIRLYNLSSSPQCSSISERVSDELRLFPVEQCISFHTYGFVKFSLNAKNCSLITMRNFSDPECSIENSLQELQVGECYPSINKVLLSKTRNEEGEMNIFGARYGYIFRDDICFPGLRSYDFSEGCKSSVCSDYCFGVPKHSFGEVCSGHGICYDVDTCKCDENYFGLYCNVSICYGVFSNFTEACSNHGECSGFQKCDCDSDYFGDFCNYTSCYGIISNESSSCGSHGICMDSNTCICQENYFGSQCNITSCFGIFSNFSSSCGNHGSCNHFDLCECSEYYYGKICNITTCDGVFSNSTKSCSGGRCVDHDKCICKSNYFGEFCNITICYSLLGNLTNSCDGHGECVKYNTCDCFDGYYGETCNNTECFNASSNNDIVVLCSGHGNCSNQHKCVCDENYFGFYCDVTSCNSILSNHSSVCNDKKGSCTSFGICNCSTEYSGNWCETFDGDDSSTPSTDDGKGISGGLSDGGKIAIAASAVSVFLIVVVVLLCCCVGILGLCGIVFLSVVTFYVYGKRKKSKVSNIEENQEEEQLSSSAENSSDDDDEEEEEEEGEGSGDSDSEDNSSESEDNESEDLISGTKK